MCIRDRYISLYFVQDENNYINSLLQVGSGSGSNEKSTGSGPGGPEITGSGSSSLKKSASILHTGWNKLYIFFLWILEMFGFFRICIFSALENYLQIALIVRRKFWLSLLWTLCWMIRLQRWPIREGPDITHDTMGYPAVNMNLTFWLCLSWPLLWMIR